MSRLYKIYLSMKDLKIWLNSIYCKIFIYIHKNLYAPQTSDLFEKLALIFLYIFHSEHSFLNLKIKKLSPKINVNNIKHRLSLMKVKSIEKCSFGAFCNTFDLH